MELARQFFEGLDGPASLTFLGILVTAFLLGVVPSGFAYMFQVRDLRRRLNNHARAHQTTAQERNLLNGQLERQQTELSTATERIRRQSTERAQLDQALLQARKELDRLQAELLASRIESTEAARHVEAIQSKMSTVTAQLQSLRQSDRPRMAPAVGAFDLDTLASLKAARTRADSLEMKVNQLTSDNELLRRQLAS